jgi:small subunit ribosomal protein S1
MIIVGVNKIKKKVSTKLKSVHCYSKVGVETIEKDINKDKNYETFQRLLKNSVVSYDVGDKVYGDIVSIENRSVLVDIGLKDYAILPFDEISITGGHAADKLIEREKREFLVISSSSRDVQLTLSLKAIEIELAWDRARERINSGSIMEVPVIEAIKGGFRVCMDGQTSFLPVSQISPKYLNDELIGKTIPVKLVDVDETKNRCVCSNRKAIAEEETTVSTFEEIKVGDVVQGYVQNLTAFGAFVDLNGIVGLLHVSQISNDRISSIEGVFLVGEPIKCMVLAVDKEKGRLSLTTKKLEPSPGDMLRNRELVMETAEEMAKLFRERVAAAEAALKAVEEKKKL